MYKICSTLLASLEEVFKAVRRVVANKIAMFLSRALYIVTKKTAKFYTQAELDTLKKDCDNINNVLTVRWCAR